MKSNKVFKKLVLCLLVLILLLSFCLPIFAITEETELPHISKWVNNAAYSSKGLVLNDTWAVDDTGIYTAKYVLINQQGSESLRIDNYPEDVIGEDSSVCPKYVGTFELCVPEDISGEIIVTFENEGAEYNISFKEEDSYKTSVEFMPGTYTLTSIEVLTDVNGKYSLKDDFILSISDKDVSHSFDIVKQNETLEEAVTDGSSEKKTFFVSAYDENNDLLKDTVMLFVTIVVIFVGYLIISRKRKKVEEIKRR